MRTNLGECYPEVARLVSVGVTIEHLLADRGSDAWRAFSIELCGGTHLPSTAACGAFALIHEESVAKGVRRLVAATGEVARQALDRAKALELEAELLAERAVELLEEQHADALSLLVAEVASSQLPLRARRHLEERLEKIQAKVRRARKDRAAKAGPGAQGLVADLLNGAVEAGGAKIVVGLVPETPAAELRDAVDWLRQQAGSAAVLLFATGTQRVDLLAALTPDLVGRGLDSRRVLHEASQVVGGTGGGRAELAQGGGDDPSRVGEAATRVRRWLVEQLV